MIMMNLNQYDEYLLYFSCVRFRVGCFIFKEQPMTTSHGRSVRFIDDSGEDLDSPLGPSDQDVHVGWVLY